MSQEIDTLVKQEVVKNPDSLAEKVEASELEYLRAHLDRFAILKSPRISDRQYSFISSRMEKISLCIKQREAYIAKMRIDNEIFGTFWGRDFLDNVTDKLINGDRGMYDRLRLIWNFSGLPIINYRHAETFPIVDPIFNRYLKLHAVSPKPFRITAPSICGEAGWKVDNGLVNVDVAVTQERLLYVYFTGVHDWLVTKTCPTLMEIGAGSGMFAYGLINSLPSCRYIICDVPESLTMQFTYLNLALPNKKHYVCNSEGLFEIRGPQQADKKVELQNVADGIIYIPNYMMHLYDKLIKADFVYNAMSLHEMHTKQIKYYTNTLRQILEPSIKPLSLWDKLSRGQSQDEGGIFLEVNAHRGEENAVNTPHLQENLKFKQKFDFYDLSLAPTLWTNHRRLIGKMTSTYHQYRQKYDLDALFRIELPFHYPKLDFQKMLKMVDEDLGKYIDFDLVKYMNDRGWSFANHLDGYLRRFLNIDRRW